MAAEPMYAVWTRDDSEEWAKKNGGNTNALITHGVTLGRAERVLKVLRSTYGDLHAEIHPAATPPRSGTVGNVEAHDMAVTVTADRLDLSPADVASIVKAHREDRRRVIKSM